jgi:cold shock CspA family protein
MDTSMNGDYRSGTVQIYDDKAGYGSISPDEPQDKSDRLLVHRRSLRN